MTGNECFILRMDSGGKLQRIEITKNVLISDDKTTRVHRVLPADEPAYYMIEQLLVINPDDAHGRAWRTICETQDHATAKRFITAHNNGNKEIQSALIRRFQRFGCPITYD